MPTPTTNYALDKPVVAGDAGAWGAQLNADLDTIDTVMQANEDAAAAAQATADAALPVAGGTMTGELDLLTAKATRVDLGSIATTATLDFDLANAWTATVGGTVTLAVANVPSGTFVVGGILQLTNGGSSVVTWPAAFTWEGGTVPTLTTSGVDLIAFVSFDAGTTFLATALLDLS